MKKSSDRHRTTSAFRERPFGLLFLIVFVAFLQAAPAHAGETIRVMIVSSKEALHISAPGGMVVTGRRVPQGATSLVLSRDLKMGERVRIRARKGYVQLGGNAYRGAIEVSRNRNGAFVAINELDIEDYLKGVIGSETPSLWDIEVLKAQAIASRSYALYQKRNTNGKDYHIQSTINDQVYRGASGESGRSSRAGRETRGIVLQYNGRVIPAFYHASCGGHTENAAILWGVDEPYLQGVECECQDIVSEAQWERRVTVPRFLEAVRREGYDMTSLKRIEMSGVTRAGRVMKILAYSDTGPVAIPAEVLRSSLGITFIPSVFFELEMDADEVVISGRGNGHGVGMCQWGAKEMAERGRDYRTILAHYYPGTKLKRLW